METHIEQYAVLQWVWNLAKEYDTCVHCREMQQLRDHISTIMGNIVKSGAIDFDQLRLELGRGLS